MEKKKREPTEAIQPTYVLAPGYYPGFEEEDEINLADYIRVLWRRRMLIVLGTIGCAVAAFLISQILPKQYQATATLILQPPRFSTELTPQPLSVETYEALVKSGHVQAELRNRLIADGKLRQTESMGTLTTEIFASKDRTQPYSPLIDLVVRADSPEKAPMIANAWADVFVSINSELTLQGKEGTVQFIEQQYPLAAKALEDQESNLKSRQDGFATSILNLDTSWTNRILAYETETGRLKTEGENSRAQELAAWENETQRLIETYEKESERLRQQFQKEWRTDLLRQELQVNEEKRSAFQNELLDTEVGIETKRDTLEQLKKALEEQPKFIVLSKAITDEALWAKLGTDTSGALSKELDDLKMRSELINPIYQNLLDQLTNMQVEYETLLPQKEHLVAELESVQKEVERLRDEISVQDVEFFNLRKDRDGGLAELKRTRAVGLETLQRTLDTELQNTLATRGTELTLLQKRRDTELGELQRTRDLEIEQLTRERDSNQQTFATLAGKYQEAQLAKAEQETNVKVGAYAAQPGEAVSPRVLLNTALALVIGFMLTIMLAFVWEFVESGVLSEQRQPKVRA